MPLQKICFIIVFCWLVRTLMYFICSRGAPVNFSCQLMFPDILAICQNTNSKVMFKMEGVYTVSKLNW